MWVSGTGSAERAGSSLRHLPGTGAGPKPGPAPAPLPPLPSLRNRSPAGAASGPISGTAAGAAPARATGTVAGGGSRRRMVTVARSSIGVSDGLRFRDGLASWQNLAFAGELGHAVLPSAPVGLIHGVARPGGARSTAPGGPLLLRAAPAGADGEAEAAAGPAPASAGRTTGGDRARGRSSVPTAVQRSSSTKSPGSSGNGAPGRQDRAGGATAVEAAGAAAPARSTARVGGTAPGAATASASQQARDTAPAPVSLRRAGPVAVRPRRTAPPLIIARRPAMTLRRIAGVLPLGGLRTGHCCRRRNRRQQR